MKTKFLTLKQEAFCQAYVKLGDKSKAYREAYSIANMKSDTINKRAFELYHNGEVTGRIEFLQEEIEQRNNIEINEIIKGLVKIFRFDIAELYDEKGALKDIQSMSITARQMI